MVVVDMVLNWIQIFWHEIIAPAPAEAEVELVFTNEGDWLMKSIALLLNNIHVRIFEHELYHCHIRNTNTFDRSSVGINTHCWHFAKHIRFFFN
jgi:hypothetical protein